MFEFLSRFEARAVPGSGGCYGCYGAGEDYVAGLGGCHFCEFLLESI